MAHASWTSLTNVPDDLSTLKAQVEGILSVLAQSPTFSAGDVVYRKVAWDTLAEDFEIFNGTTNVANSPFTVDSQGFLNTNATIDKFNKHIMTKYKTADTDLVIELDYRMNVVDSTSFGPSLALVSTNAVTGRQHSNLVFYNASDGAQKGNFRLYSKTSGISGLSAAIGSPQVTVNTTIYGQTNTTYRITLAISGATIFGRITNLTTGATYGAQLVQSLLGPTDGIYLSNTSRITITCQGGDFTVLGLTVRTFQPTRPDVLFIGDSKTRGQNAGNFARSYPQQFAELTRASIANHSGGGDGTVEIDNLLDHLLSSLVPNYAVLNIGRNDLSHLSAATWKARYDSIVTKLKAAKAKVYHLLPIPETAVNQDALRAHIIDTYGPGTQSVPGPDDPLIDLASNWDNATMLSSDNIHPTPAGMIYIATKIKEVFDSESVAFF